MRALLPLLLACAMSGAGAQTAVAVYAAGSLRDALSEIGSLWQARGGAEPEFTFGASGLLRERIEKGAPAQVFASADTDHPRQLAAAGGWEPPVVFTRNALCALTAANVDATPDTLLATILRDDIRLGASTPRADPSGDYVVALFQKADALRPGAAAVLESKAMQLTGGASSPAPPPGRNAYAWLVDSGKADVFLTYCTNAAAAQREVARLKVVHLPPQLQVGAAYGLTVRKGAPESARRFAAFLLAPSAQAVFARLGFGAP